MQEMDEEKHNNSKIIFDSDPQILNTPRETILGKQLAVKNCTFIIG